MREIILADGVSVAVVDDEDYEKVAGYRWHRATERKGHVEHHYAGTTVYPDRNWTRPRKLLMHRLVLGIGFGDARHVDHRDNNGLNNTRANLRICTPSENQGNRRPNANRKHPDLPKGVWPGKTAGTFVARCAGRHLGTFRTAAEAHAAYATAAIEKWGEFAHVGEEQP